MVLVGVAGVKGASFVGVPTGSSTLDTHHPDQEGRSYAERAGRCSPPLEQMTCWLLIRSAAGWG
jgi:hypothetical protein